jgi:putative membrane protein
MRAVFSSLALMALAPEVAFAQDGYRYGPHMMWWGGGWFGMILGPILFIVGLAIAIALALALARMIGPQRPAAPPTRTPLDTLKERFARGEIDKAEYEDRRRALQD